MKRTILTLVIVSLIFATACNKKDTTEKVNKNSDFLSSLEFKNGYPTNETSKKLYDEMDYQRAVQAYIWGFPLVSSASIRRGLFEDMEMSYYDIILYENFLLLTLFLGNSFSQ